MIRDYTNHSPVGIQRAHCSSPCFLFPLLLFTFKFFYFFLHLCFLPIFIHRCQIRLSPSVSCLAIYLCGKTMVYNETPSFSNPLSLWPPAKPTQMGGHTHSNTHTHIHKGKKICEEAPACRAHSEVNLSNPSHMSHHHIQTHTQDMC